MRGPYPGDLRVRVIEFVEAGGSRRDAAEHFEVSASSAIRWLLVLDTVPGMSGYRLYQRAGWTEVGTIPDYALLPDGRLCDTAVFWKRLDR